MPRRKQRTASDQERDPLGFAAMIERYAQWMQVTAYSEVTIGKRVEFLDRFAIWCAERAIGRPSEVHKALLERYQRHLYHHRKKNGQPLSFASQYIHISSLREFFKHLAKHNLILFNPAAELALPRRRHCLPKHVLNASEVERVLSAIDVDEPLGVRDRAVLETLYSTGMRRMELAHLQLYDVDPERGIVIVRQGKGRKDRLVPIGERALAWVDKYLAEVRPLLVVASGDTTLFLTREGEALSLDHLTRIAHRRVVAAGLGKQGSCHLFRHTMATLMLENGADIRHIQIMLGHESLSSTEIYTHVAIQTLKEVHTAAHPARLERTARRASVERSTGCGRGALVFFSCRGRRRGGRQGLISRTPLGPGAPTGGASRSARHGG